MGRLNVQLIIIDPQKDFMDDPDSALPVTGANADMDRVGTLIRRAGGKFDDIHVTLDSHRILDIAHPAMWIDQNGNNPSPFTIISHDDIVNRIWMPRNYQVRIPQLDNRTLGQYALDYTNALADNGKFSLMIWPPHCLIGTPGHAVQNNLALALQEWEVSQFAAADYVTKGSNPWTEHFGGLMAEVPLPSDPSTMLNTDFLNVLQQADFVYVAGEASSHCVMNTVQQIADNIGEQHIAKFWLLKDCMSPVLHPQVDFPKLTAEWMKGMEHRGMKLTTSVEIFA